MSRIGKLPISIVDGVTISFDGSIITVVGPKGTLQCPCMDGVSVEIGEKEVVFSIEDESNKTIKAYWGLMRALVQNMIIGVTEGFEKKLQVIGVGYNAKVQGTTLLLNLGYSHPIEHKLPEGITAVVDKDPKGNDMVIIQGIDKQLVGEQAAKVRAYRKPEPYKGKGVRYLGEYIKMKAGKTSSK